MLQTILGFFDNAIIHRMVRIARQLRILEPGAYEQNTGIDELDYSRTDIHYDAGFHLAQLTNFLNEKSFKMISAYSYHWIYPDSIGGWVQQFLTRINFVIERLPLSQKLGRYISITGRKL
jgi:hypothetical protein